MLKYVLATVLLGISALILAQVPDAFNYQAILRNSDGTMKINEVVTLQISIVNEQGASAYLEIHNTATNEFGLVNVVIGEGATTDDLSDVDWSNGPYFLDITVNGLNLGASPLLSVPYALYSRTTDVLHGEITESQISDLQSYLTHESDPHFSASPAYQITTGNVGDWNTAYSWGNHASAGYVPGIRTLTLNGTALDLSENRSWTVGTVTSVGLSLPDIFSVSGSPVTTGGTLAASLVSQTGNRVFASPNIFNGPPYFRSLMTGDIPDLPWSKITTGKPTTLAGYGITDGVNKEYIDNILEAYGITLPDNYAGILTDIEGNTYRTVTIGYQTWMAENLRTGTFKTGEAIPWITKDDDWKHRTTPAYCWADETDKAKYGCFYNWYTVNTGNLCPTGWHVPSDAEWQQFELALGMSGYVVNQTDWRGTNEGGKLKEKGTAHWITPNTGATNETGFSAIPAGYRDGVLGSMHNIGYYGYLWTSSEYDSSNGWKRQLGYFSEQIYRWPGHKSSGFCVRCIKD